MNQTFYSSLRIKTKQTCPGCGRTGLFAQFRLRRQPVVLNYRFPTATAARRVKRRDLLLAQCDYCGLISNRNFDPSLIPYDENYENRQSFSPAFNVYLQKMANDLIKRNRLRGGRILEVGCGKGDFLRLLCQKASASGIGYDTTYEGPSHSVDKRVRFVSRYVAAQDIADRCDLVLCRHVVEHIADIGRFLSDLHSIAIASGSPTVAIETPALEWIVANGCFLDLFYEHCNYFSMPCLAFLCGSAGFSIRRHKRVFEGQYQLIELKPRAEGSQTAPPRIAKETGLARFPRVMEGARRKLEQRLKQAGAAKGWAVWGAGGKGVALINQLTLERPRFAVDSNPAKQGCVIPGTAVPVISPEDPRVLEAPVLLVVNPNYLQEITALLHRKGFRHTVLSM